MNCRDYGHSIRLGFRASVLCALASCLALTGFGAGNLCTWTGAGGDGKWSTAANWDTPPVSGNNDLLAFRGDTALAVSNDVANFSVGGLLLSGTGAKTLAGETIVLAGNYIKAANNNGTANAREYAVSNASVTVISAPVHCAGNVRLLNAYHPGGSGTCSLNVAGALTVASGKILYVGDPYAWGRDTGPTRHYTFSGPIDASAATIEFANWGQSNVYLDNTVDVNAFSFDYARNPLYLPPISRSVRVRAGSVTLRYGNVHFRAPNTFYTDDMVIGWNSSQYDKSYLTWYLDGSDQTVLSVGVAFDKPAADTTGRAVESTAAATLTFRPATDRRSYVGLRGAVSLVYDPTADCTFELSNRVHNTTGTINVRAGTLKLSGATRFDSMPEITVAANAGFTVNSTATSASLAGLTRLTLGAGARFTITDQTAVAPFTANKVMVSAEGTSVFAIPSALTVSVAVFCTNGVPLAPGVYTGADGVEDAVRLPCLAGAGKLSVSADAATVWKGGSGTWTEAGNWTGGLPSTSRAGYLLSGTATVSAAPAAAAGDLTMVVPAGKQATLQVAAPLAFESSAIDIGDNSRMTIDADGRVDYRCRTTAADEASVVRIRAGGELFVNGGTFVTSNLYGRIKVEKGGSLRMNGGEFHAAPPANTSYSSVLFLDGGTVALTNATMRLGYNFNDASHLASSPMLTTQNGSVFLMHDSKLIFDQWFWRGVFGSGEVILTGSSQVKFHGYDRAGVSCMKAGETARLTLKDSSKVTGPQEFAVGDSVTGAKSYLVLDSPGVSVSGYAGMQVGCRHGYGEVDVRAGYITGGGSYGFHIGGQSPVDGLQADGCMPTGVVKVSGGALLGNGTVNARPMGIVVGDGCLIPVSGTSRVTGRLEISGTGVVTNNQSYFTVGGGRADGTVTLTGGAFHGTSSYSGLIGFGGGTGRWVQSAGTADFNAGLFVGGASTNQLGRGDWKSANAPESCKTSKGLVEVTGGTLTLSSVLRVSYDGEGTVRLGGDGKIVAVDAFFTNTWDAVNAVTYPAHLEYVFGETGTGSLQLSRTAVLADTTKIAVDLSAYNGRKAKFRLIATPDLRADLSALDVTFTDTRASGARLDHVASLVTKSDGLYLAISRGTLMLFR